MEIKRGPRTGTKVGQVRAGGHDSFGVTTASQLTLNLRIENYEKSSFIFCLLK